MCGENPRAVRTRVSDNRAGGASEGKGSAIVEAVWTEHGCGSDRGKRGNGLLRSKEETYAETVVEIDEMACGLFGVIIMRCATTAIVFAIMMMHDQFDMVAVVLDERRCTLLAVHDVREVTLRSGANLPRQ